MDWNPPPEAFRKLRVDPPAGRESEFAVLYTAASLPAAAAECRVLCVDPQDRYTWNKTKASEYWVARYLFDKPALFVPIDGPNRERLGLENDDVPYGGYAPFQAVSMGLFQRLGGLVHGLSWQSFHRGQPGRSYAIWHHRKLEIGLRITSPTPPHKLDADAEWRRFVADHPEVEGIEPAAP
jgi:hypothetical protein